MLTSEPYSQVHNERECQIKWNLPEILKYEINRGVAIIMLLKISTLCQQGYMKSFSIMQQINSSYICLKIINSFASRAKLLFLK